MPLDELDTKLLQFLSVCVFSSALFGKLDPELVAI
jgi:hypothetical protein